MAFSRDDFGSNFGPIASSNALKSGQARSHQFAMNRSRIKNLDELAPGRLWNPMALFLPSHGGNTGSNPVGDAMISLGFFAPAQ
jgi:hypothetical protein